MFLFFYWNVFISHNALAEEPPTYGLSSKWWPCWWIAWNIVCFFMMNSIKYSMFLHSMTLGTFWLLYNSLARISYSYFLRYSPRFKSWAKPCIGLALLIFKRFSDSTIPPFNLKVSILHKSFPGAIDQLWTHLCYDFLTELKTWCTQCLMFSMKWNLCSNFIHG
jgi:hypothetical protein